MSAVPAHVLAAFGWARARLTPIAIGLINETHRVEIEGDRFVLQRLHPVFAAEVNEDIDAITTHLAARGVVTPRLVRTLDGSRHVEDAEGRPWRALTFVEGRCLTELRTTALAHAAGAVAGRFTRATSDLEHRFSFTRSSVHDTAAHLAKLTRALRDHDPADDSTREARVLAEEILAHAADLPSLAGLPTRIVHGDLKVSNILFAHDRDEAVCLVDLDTMAHGTIATEMGDALRSWTNPKGEDDTRGAVDPGLFGAAIEGYLSETRDLLAPREIESFVDGLETIALELSARFCLDAFDDRYFGWDAQKYPSRRAHNAVRARSQLSLARSARTLRPELEQIVARLR
ncbi:MAG: aminoglycoside phosphotransferase family protein [Sandaracinaceae bacterium]|nr:aminoglycoside phosphotransferase family protein [Sandaracinaceae bacterium]